MKTKKEGKYCIIRSNGSGVWAATVKELDGDTVLLSGARRIWYWSGAATLSQLAKEGVKHPNQCKFPVEVDEVMVFNVIEIIDVTDAARQNIAEVPIWTA